MAQTFTDVSQAMAQSMPQIQDITPNRGDVIFEQTKDGPFSYFRRSPYKKEYGFFIFFLIMIGVTVGWLLSLLMYVSGAYDGLPKIAGTGEIHNLRDFNGPIFGMNLTLNQT
jgi:hypothetical protein